MYLSAQHEQRGQESITESCKGTGPRLPFSCPHSFLKPPLYSLNISMAF